MLNLRNGHGMATEETQSLTPRRRYWHPVPFGLLIAVLLSLAIDVPIAAYAKDGKHPRWLAELLENVETFRCERSRKFENHSMIPAPAGVQKSSKTRDSRLRGNDGQCRRLLNDV